MLTQKKEVDHATKEVERLRDGKHPLNQEDHPFNLCCKAFDVEKVQVGWGYMRRASRSYEQFDRLRCPRCTLIGRCGNERRSPGWPLKIVRCDWCSATIAKKEPVVKCHAEADEKSGAPHMMHMACIPHIVSADSEQYFKKPLI